MRIQDCLRLFVIPSKRYTHDCVDTGDDWVLPAATPTNFLCDCALRDYKVENKSLWFPATSKVQDTIEDAHLTISVGLHVNGPKDTFIKMQCIIPHPIYGDIPCFPQEKVLAKNNTDWPMMFNMELYNSIDGAPHLHGFILKIESSAEVTIKDRSVLVKVT